jgi:hypothetical protein
MANAFQTSAIVTNEVLRIAHNASAFLGNVNSDFEDSWAGQYKPGSVLNARRPVQFTHRTGDAANIQDITESTTPVTIQPLLGVDFAVGSTDLATSIGSNGQVDPAFRQRYLKPAGLKIAAILDYSLGQIMKNGFHQMVGTPGTPPATFADLLNAGVPLDRMSVPRDGMRMAAVEPGANATILAGVSSLFNSQQVLSDQYKTGVLKTGAGLDIAMSQNVPSHTVGPLGGTPVGQRREPRPHQRRHHGQPVCGDDLAGHQRLDGGRCGSPEPRRHLHHRGRVLGQPRDQAVDRRPAVVPGDGSDLLGRFGQRDGRDLAGHHRRWRLPERDGPPGQHSRRSPSPRAPRTRRTRTTSSGTRMR